MSTTKVRWEEMLPHEFVAARDQFPVGYMAYGLAEPHGGYNALGLDWLKAYALLERTAKEQGGILAPPVAWHIQEVPEFHDDGKGGGWLAEVGVKQSLCSSLPADLFYRMVMYQIRAFDARGFKAGIFVTGHYGGVENVLRIIADYYLRRTGSPIRLHMIADWEVIDEKLPHRGDHAGVCETSQLMVLQKGMVDLSHQITGIPELGDKFAGFVNFAKGPIPSEKIGNEVVDSQVRNLGAAARRLLKEHQPRPGWKAPNLNEVEVIWKDFYRLTRKYWNPTLEEYKSGKIKYGVIPPWEELERETAIN